MNELDYEAGYGALVQTGKSYAEQTWFAQHHATTPPPPPRKPKAKALAARNADKSWTIIAGDGTTFASFDTAIEYAKEKQVTLTMRGCVSPCFNPNQLAWSDTPRWRGKRN